MALRPLIAICGTTGVGKSKLAIELAQALWHYKTNQTHEYRGARIINADAMQVYNGMDILTNKVPLEEQGGIEHLLMGFKQPGEQYVVGQWVRDAMQLIDETHQKKQIPIVVGGTAYWMQHLIFPNRLTSYDQIFDEPTTTTAPPTASSELAKAVASLSPDARHLFEGLPIQPPSATTDPSAAFALHALLAALDPIVAQRWHWKDTRKVLRSLNIIKDTGRLPSEVIGEQAEVLVQPRYRTLCLWLYAKPHVLNPRLDARVDDMMKQGLLREVQDLMQIAVADRPQCSARDRQLEQTETSTANFDYTLGIYQSIGYREFSEYLNMPDPPERALGDAIERMKLSTRKYAKRQVSWIRNKLLPAVKAANAANRSVGGLDVVPTFLLDATELGDAWTSNVRDIAERITQDLLEGHELPDPLALSDAAHEMLTIPEKPTDPVEVLNARRKVICPVCTVNSEQPVMIEERREWDVHVRTRLHRRLSSKTSARSEQSHPRDRRKDHMRCGEDDSDDSLEGTQALFSSRA